MNEVFQLAAQGKASDIARQMRALSLFSNYYFVKVVLNYPQLTDYFHKQEMEDFIDRWAQGHTKQFVEWSRGFFKSTCFTIGTGMWVVLPHTENDKDFAIDHLKLPEELWDLRIKLHNQNCRQLLAFETHVNSTKKVGEIKWHFEENILFRQLFPEIAYDPRFCPKWTNECLVIPRIGEGARHQEGTFEAIGVGGALQSRHYDIVWEDDLVGKAAVESDEIMQKTIRWHGLLHGAFVDATRQIRFGISNRWGLSDLNSHVRANEPDFVFHTRSAFTLDPEHGHEIPTFPYDGTGRERFTLENLARMKENSSMTEYDWSCQYLNDPRLPGDAEANLSAVHTYKVIGGRIECNCGVSCDVKSLAIYLHYDPYNAKGVNSVSCPAIVAVGLLADRHIFVLDYFLTKGSYEKIYDKLYDYNDSWNPVEMTFEDVGHQNMTAFHIRSMEKTLEHRQKHRKFRKITAVPTGGKQKESRIRDYLLPFIIKTAKFAIREKHLVLLDMLKTFPNKMLGHDYDLLDALAQGALVWRFPIDDELAQDQQQLDDAILQELGRSYSVMETRT